MPKTCEFCISKFRKYINAKHFYSNRFNLKKSIWTKSSSKKAANNFTNGHGVKRSNE